MCKDKNYLRSKIFKAVGAQDASDIFVAFRNKFYEHKWEMSEAAHKDVGFDAAYVSFWQSEKFKEFFPEGDCLGYNGMVQRFYSHALWLCKGRPDNDVCIDQAVESFSKDPIFKDFFGKGLDIIICGTCEAQCGCNYSADALPFHRYLGENPNVKKPRPIDPLYL